MKREEYVDLMRKRRKKVFVFLYLAIISMIASFLLVFFQDYISKGLGVSEFSLVIISILIGVIALGFLLNYYLTFSNIRMPYYNRFDDERGLENINHLFNRHLSKNFVELYGYGEDDRYYNSEDEKKEYPKLFDTHFDEIKNKYLDQFTYDLKYTKAFEDLYSLEKKIRNQIDRLVGNSNLNLIIGTITTLIAIIILGFSIYQKNSFNDSVSLMSHYIPRISTVIFVEIFSFFFLKLYRKNLDEIKYFQNEITNLNFKISSLKASLILEDKETASKILSKFSDTERNFILKKGESTERIESERLETSMTNNILEKVTSIINGKK